MIFALTLPDGEMRFYPNAERLRAAQDEHWPGVTCQWRRTEGEHCSLVHVVPMPLLDHAGFGL